MGYRLRKTHPVLGIIAIFAIMESSHASRINPVSCLRASLLGSTPEEIQTRLREFWKQEGPVLIKKGKLSHPLTFSFDSEIFPGDMFRTLAKDPKYLVRIESLFQETGFQIPRDSLLAQLGMSDKQFRVFGVRKGISQEKEAYVPTDLNPDYFESLVRRGFKALPQFMPEFLKISYDWFKDSGYPVKCILDLGNVEAQHQTWETSPSRLRAVLVDRLHKDFRSPKTHFHLGLPADIISTEKGYEMTRAVETRAILRLARNWLPGTREVSHTEFSALRKFNTMQRGIVGFHDEEFPNPVRSHNLEVRQWLDLDDGFDDIATASRMAVEHNRIIVRPQFDVPKIWDRQTGNLLGALRYAALALENLGSGVDPAYAKKLSSFADEIEQERAISDQLRAELAQFLNRNDVIEHLGPEAFLKRK